MINSKTVPYKESGDTKLGRSTSFLQSLKVKIIVTLTSVGTVRATIEITVVCDVARSDTS